MPGAFVVSCAAAQALGLRPWLAALPLRERRLRARLLMSAPKIWGLVRALTGGVPRYSRTAGQGDWPEHQVHHRGSAVSRQKPTAKNWSQTGPNCPISLQTVTVFHHGYGAETNGWSANRSRQANRVNLQLCPQKRRLRTKRPTSAGPKNFVPKGNLS